MNKRNSPTMETLDRTEAKRTRVGWGFWALWVSALAVVGALSYRVAVQPPLAEFALPPVAIVIFAVLAGGVQGVTIRGRSYL
jgi:hypothetical protein